MKKERIIINLIKKHTGHHDKISNILDKTGIDLQDIGLCISDEIFDLIGVERDKNGEHDYDIGLLNDMFDCGENEDKILEFLQHIDRLYDI